MPQPAAGEAAPAPLRVGVAEQAGVAEHTDVAEQRPAPRLETRALEAIDADAPTSTDAPASTEAHESTDAQPAAPAPCRAPGMPAILETTQPIELVERGDRILMRFSEWGLERVIYMQPGRGPASGQRSPLGASFGRWENATLAIFTLYIDYPFFDARGTPQSKDVTVLERYTASADGRRLDYRITVTDPATFTRPVVRQGFMTFDPAAQTQELVAKHCVG
jgi:hypothetical protein